MALSMQWWPGTQQPSIWEFAAFTMTSAASVAMSPRQRLRRPSSGVRGKRPRIDDSHLGDAGPEHAVLRGEELVGRRHWLAHVDEGTVGFEEGPLVALQ